MKKVLVIIDMQKDFLLPDGKLAIPKDNRPLEKRIRQKIEDHDGPIIVTFDTHIEGDVEFNQFPEHCVKGTTGWELVHDVATPLLSKDNVVNIEKHSFQGEEVTQKLLEYQKNGYEFEFVGVCTHICVHDNVAGFVHRSKEELNQLPKITINKELVDDFDDEMAANALIRLQRLSGVQVL